MITIFVFFILKIHVFYVTTAKQMFFESYSLIALHSMVHNAMSVDLYPNVSQNPVSHQILVHRKQMWKSPAVSIHRNESMQTCFSKSFSVNWEISVLFVNELDKTSILDMKSKQNCSRYI